MSRSTLHLPLSLLVAGALFLGGCSDPDGPPGATDAATVTDGPVVGTAAPQPDVSTWTPAPAPTGQEGQPRGLDVEAAEVDTDDPIAVAEAFARTILSSDTAIDASPLDADRRAARWATEEYADVLTQPRPGRGGTDWLALERDNGWLSVELAEHPAVEAGLIEVDGLVTEVPLLVTITAHDADLPDRSTSVLVSLIRNTPGDPWEVTEWHDTDAPGGTP